MNEFTLPTHEVTVAMVAIRLRHVKGYEKKVYIEMGDLERWRARFDKREAPKGWRIIDIGPPKQTRAIV